MGLKLGDISPLVGIATGKGMMGKLAAAGGMGLIPGAIARDAQSSREEEEQAKAKAAAAVSGQPMRKGGKVSASSRGDGIAKRGKTKGKVV